MSLPLAPFRHKHDGEILRLAVPAFGALVAEPLFLLADSAIVGHLGTAQLAGLGIAATILASTVSLCIFLAYGTTAAVARSLGAGDLPGALRRGIDGLWLAVLIGGVLSIAIAGQALTGRYLGAGDLRGAREATRRMVEWSIALGVILGIAVFGTRALIAPLFTPDGAVQNALISVLIVVAIIQPAAGWVFALDGVLIGAGDARYIALAQAVTVAVFAPFAAAVLAFDLGLDGLWWAIGAWVLARLIVMAWRERGDSWAQTGARP
jgi:Na+-driven multidrug efflux pump